MAAITHSEVELERIDTTARDASARSSASVLETAATAPIPLASNTRKVAICLSAFLIIFTTCGSLFSFGVYQELYQAMSLEPNNPFSGATPARIDLIGTLGASFMTIGAPLATGWTRLFGVRPVVLLGAILFFAASMLASYSQHLWEFQLTQGLLFGLAICFSYMPAVTVAPTWYGRRRGLALGIILSGTGVGGLVWAPIVQALNHHLGYRNALRIMGSITTAVITAGACVLDWDPASKARIKEEASRQRKQSKWRSLWNIPLVDMRIARSSKFTWQLFATCLQSAAYYTPGFFFAAYARTLGYSRKEGANFIAINNACNAIGKIALGVLADKYGRLNMLLITTGISAVCSFAFWTPSTLVALGAGRGLFITYTIMYGTFASAYVSLFPAALVELFGPQNFASINGILYMARGLGSLAGTPAAGALIRNSAEAAVPHGYLNMTILVGALLTGATVGVVWVRIVDKQ